MNTTSCFCVKMEFFLLLLLWTLARLLAAAMMLMLSLRPWCHDTTLKPKGEKCLFYTLNVWYERKTPINHLQQIMWKFQSWSSESVSLQNSRTLIWVVAGVSSSRGRSCNSHFFSTHSVPTQVKKSVSVASNKWQEETVTVAHRAALIMESWSVTERRRRETDGDASGETARRWCQSLSLHTVPSEPLISCCFKDWSTPVSISIVSAATVLCQVTQWPEALSSTC